MTTPRFLSTALALAFVPSLALAAGPAAAPQKTEQQKFLTVGKV